MTRFISPLTWPGGKSKKYKIIKSFFPKNSNDYEYIEPFFGGGSIGLNSLRDDLFKKYVFTDINEKLMDFWFKYLFEYKWNEINKNWFYPNVPNLESVKVIENDLPDYLKFILNNNLAYNGLPNAQRSTLRLKQNWNLAKADRIIACGELLDTNLSKIMVCPCPFEDTLSRFVSPGEKLFYLDPPYYENNKHIYENNFNHNDWIRFNKFINRINNTGQLFILSINDCSETRKMFKDFNIHEYEWFYSSSNSKRKTCKVGKELIITNYRREEIIKNAK
jgi:DNA adenine methylase